MAAAVVVAVHSRPGAVGLTRCWGLCSLMTYVDQSLAWDIFHASPYRAFQKVHSSPSCNRQEKAMTEVTSRGSC